MFLSFPASENIMANVTQIMPPSATDSIVPSQSDKISASLSVTPGPPLSLSTSQVAELTIESDFFSSSSSPYFSQDAPPSISESLIQSIIFQQVNLQSRTGCCSFLKPQKKFSKFRLLNWWEAYTGPIIRNQFHQWLRGRVTVLPEDCGGRCAAHFPNNYSTYDQNLRFIFTIFMTWPNIW